MPEYMSGKLAKKRTFDLTKEDSSQLGDRLAQILDLAMPGSTIKLPAREIEMPDVVIRKAFKIVG